MTHDAGTDTREPHPIARALLEALGDRPAFARSSLDDARRKLQLLPDADVLWAATDLSCLALQLRETGAHAAAAEAVMKLALEMTARLRSLLAQMASPSVPSWASFGGSTLERPGSVRRPGHVLTGPLFVGHSRIRGHDHG